MSTLNRRRCAVLSSRPRLRPEFQPRGLSSHGGRLRKRQGEDRPDAALHRHFRPARVAITNASSSRCRGGRKLPARDRVLTLDDESIRRKRADCAPTPRHARQGGRGWSAPCTRACRWASSDRRVGRAAHHSQRCVAAATCPVARRTSSAPRSPMARHYLWARCSPTAR